MVEPNDILFLNDFLKKHSFEIKKRIKKISKNIKSEDLQISLRYTLENSGKMLRPLLVLISARLAGGNYEDVYDAAVSMEILHNSNLVHDDIMDNSKKRRGKSTLYKKYGLNNAILTGDVLIILAYSCLLKNCSISNTKKLISVITDAMIMVCEGQGQDIEFELKESVPVLDYKKMIYKKTACFIEVCCEIGASISGASNEYIKSVKNYGRNLGMAFQIQDDILDIFGNENSFGKKLGCDLVGGKKSYLLVCALLKAKGKDRVFLNKILKNKISINQLDRYKKICLELDILKDAEMEVNKYLKLANDSLKYLPENEGKRLMKELINKVKNRKS